MKNNNIKNMVFHYIKETVGDVYPLDSKKHDGWVGYTNDFCEKNDSFLFGVSPDSLDKKPLIVFYWGIPFDIDGMSDLFDMNKADVIEYVKEYIKQFYDEPIKVF